MGTAGLVFVFQDKDCQTWKAWKVEIETKLF